jgi:lipoprotein-anchoring transpeptidase ErfK/SrfK
MRRTVVASVLALFALASAELALGKANFTGTWVLDKSKAETATPADGKEAEEADDSEGPEELAVVKIVVEQTDAELKLVRHVAAGKQEKTLTSTVDLSGKENSAVGPRGGSQVAKATWEGDKLVMVTSRTRKKPGTEVKIENKQIWSLSKDGKTLTIETVRKGPRGAKSKTLVYTKQ